jgi:hypothetical protein
VRQRLAFALLMGIVTTGIISFALMALNLGFGPAFVGIWLRAWAMAYAVVIPIILLVAPRLQAAVDRRFAAPVDGHDHTLRRKLAFALTMGVVTTGIISFALIAVNVGLAATLFLKIWLKSWAIAYLAVIPAILFIAPRVQAVVDRMFGRAGDPGR